MLFRSDQDQTPPPTNASKTADRPDQVPHQPAPEEILKAFKRDRPDLKPIRPRRASSKPSKSATDRRAFLRREGDYISDSAARLSREGSWWRLEFEADGPDAPRPPMRILPSQLLELMVREHEVAPQASYSVSGEVTLFESQNYILLRRVFRRSDSDNLSK